jgi:hypothetical protein
MNTYSGSDAKPTTEEAATARGCFRFTIGHVLAAALLVSLVAWGAVFFVIKLVVAAFH